MTDRRTTPTTLCQLTIDVRSCEQCGTRVKSHFCDCLEVQRLGGDDIPADLGECILEPLLYIRAAHHFGGLAHLTKQLLEAPEDADEAAFVDVCHFAGRAVSIVEEKKIKGSRRK